MAKSRVLLSTLGRLKGYNLVTPILALLDWQIMSGGLCNIYSNLLLAPTHVGFLLTGKRCGIENYGVPEELTCCLEPCLLCGVFCGCALLYGKTLGYNNVTLRGVEPSKSTADDVRGIEGDLGGGGQVCLCTHQRNYIIIKI